KSKEQAGWHGICASDHLWVGDIPYPHVFVAATQMACATEKTLITTSFANNLFRSPTEFAQGALSLQVASNGRFEAGLGAGWLADEIVDTGREYPEPRARVSMYVEALTIVRELLQTGHCTFKGEFYNINMTGTPLDGVSDNPPPLIAAAGGPRAIRETTPLVDRIEIKANARATRVGHLDFKILGSVTEDEVKTNIARAQAVREDIPIGVFILVGAGQGNHVKGLKGAFGDGFLSRFVGEPESVAQALHDLEGLGISRIQVTELLPGSHEALEPHLNLGE
ncbi:MAG: LLM class flavin-dependent oxidoreductase, partial [Pseudomonadota bacterium]